MHLLTSIAVLPLLSIATLAQGQSSLAGVYRIDKLTLVSADVSRSQRWDVIHSFQGGTYNIDELAERIRFRFRDTGYPLVEVGEARITRLHSCNADVSYAVHRGSQYRLSGITFNTYGKGVFATAQLRSQFHLDDGAIFSASEIGRGLENLRDLYGTAGYADFGAIPKPVYDNSRHTITLMIDIDQSRPMNFGKLLMEGIEPRAGAAKELLASWRELEGKRYNSQLLKKWLSKNAVTDSANRPFTSIVGSADPGTRNVLLNFGWDQSVVPGSAVVSPQ